MDFELSLSTSLNSDTCERSTKMAFLGIYEYERHRGDSAGGFGDESC